MGGIFLLRKIELIIFLLIIAGFVILNKNLGEMASAEQVKIVKKTVVIDPGHGGGDPGKVGVNGAKEKEINLQIAKNLKMLLEERGFSVVMTREKDEMLEGDKKEDMKKRVEIINETKPDIAVSIHQNSFTDEAVHGAQTFYYSGSEEGKQYAQVIQNALLKVDESNHREAKANDNYYLLLRTEVPTVIVECGFLSNKEEAQKLSNNQYQEEISKVIVDGIESCFGN